MTYSSNYAHIDFSKPIVFEKERINIQAKRSDLPCPTIVSDYLPPTQSMADGKMYDSKSGIEAATRRAGCYTIGNDKREPFKRKKATRAEVKAVVEKATARYERGERAK